MDSQNLQRSQGEEVDPFPFRASGVHNVALTIGRWKKEEQETPRKFTWQEGADRTHGEQWC